MKVYLATSSFFSDFKQFFPELEVINPSISSTLVKKADLVIFPGGCDVHPSRYMEYNKYSFCDEERDSIEMDILSYCIKANKKVLGVCRGLQLVYAYYGNHLIQDIKFELGKSHPSRHELDIINSPIKSAIRTTVNSLHHQGVRFETASTKDLFIGAVYDNIIEAAYNANTILVQYHPEFMMDKEFFDFIRRWMEGKVDTSLTNESLGELRAFKNSYLHKAGGTKNLLTAEAYRDLLSRTGRIDAGYINSTDNIRYSIPNPFIADFQNESGPTSDEDEELEFEDDNDEEDDDGNEDESDDGTNYPD